MKITNVMMIRYCMVQIHTDFLLCTRYHAGEVALHIVPQPCISELCLQALVNLPKILSDEEKEEYFKTTNIKDLDLITQIHNGAGQCDVLN